MALNVKVALLTCLGFIGGITWLVNQVARPVAVAPVPMLVPAVPAASETPAVLAVALDQPQRLAAAFDHASATDAARGDAVETSPIAVALIESGGVLIDEAPPELVPDTPAGPSLPPIAAASPPVAPVEAPTTAVLVSAEEQALPAAVLASDAQIPDEAPAPAESASRPQLPAGKAYRVRRGDTIVRILRREWHRDDPEAIAAFLAVNPRVGKRKGYTIRVGEELHLPSLATALAYRDVQLAEAGTQVAAGRRLPGQRRRRVYTVRQHDTLVKIAREKLNDARRWTEIAKLNGLKNADNIRPGTEILLPEPSGTET